MRNQKEQLLNNLNDMEDGIKELNAPQNIEVIFEDAVNRGSCERSKNKRNGILFLAFSMVITLFLGVNASSALAESIYRIPLLGNFAKIITIREYKVESKSSEMNVKIVGVETEEQSPIINKINEMIQSKIEDIVKDQKKLDQEYMEAYIETGGEIEELNKIETEIDYKTFYNNENMVSFSIIKTQTLAGAYDETYYFNLDINNGENLLLKDILKIDEGDIKSIIMKQMKSNMMDNKISYDLEALEGLNIEDHRKYYINDSGEIVLVFNKYEVAPGYLGEQHFIIGKLE